jgi:hypothetical protein
VILTSVIRETLLRQSYLLNVTRSAFGYQTDPFSLKIQEYLISRPTYTELSPKEHNLAQAAQELFNNEIVNSKLFKKLWPS